MNAQLEHVHILVKKVAIADSRISSSPRKPKEKKSYKLKVDQENDKLE